jgi:ubiquitin carboxyl-terminal hydrolase 9/13
VQNPTGASAGSTPAKKDPNAPQPTPLEKLLLDAGPIRTDGSDKFFGFENVSSSFQAQRLNARSSANVVTISLAVLGIPPPCDSACTVRPFVNTTNIVRSATATPLYNVYTTRLPSGNKSSTSPLAHPTNPSSASPPPSLPPMTAPCSMLQPPNRRRYSPRPCPSPPHRALSKHPHLLELARRQLSRRRIKTRPSTRRRSRWPLVQCWP